ncbi:MAG: hypothetical protein LLG14_18900 [Nocardiaceae bacterium]|nr:hypothetical protein [Nocardiaceae bacterium]
MRASDYIGREIFDANGNSIGIAADLVARPNASGQLQINAVLVTPRWRGRLLGYDTTDMRGPWVIKQLTRWLHRGTHEVAWHDVVWSAGGSR